jgi:Protein of unknown function (DUF1553)/Protein of unknown function (DUF1549)/Planctomycete cytochrome C
MIVSRMSPDPAHRRNVIALCGFLLVLFVSVPSLRAAEEPVPLFETDILPIFQEYCLPCHSDSPQHGLDLRDPDRIVKGGESGTVVTAGSAKNSLLYQKISTGRMPPGPKKVATQQIEIIRHWIDAGLPSKKNTAGPVKAATEREVMLNILHVRCLVCHGRHKQEGGLDVSTREALLKGGKSGPVIIPGKPDESLLVRQIDSGAMPPLALQRGYAVRAVTSDELEKIRLWIKGGAAADPEEKLDVGPGEDPLVSSQDRQFWSFRPPQRPDVPAVQQHQFLRNPIDAFLLKKLEEKGLNFAPPADRLVLMRRAYFDLTGLQPDPDEIRAYLKDQRPDAYERMLDQLLASPRYGERWARYWLDAAGYSDSEGANNSDSIRPDAWRYRDYVIRSLNQDKPYDRFLLEQIAGDELFDYKDCRSLTPDQIDQLVATGFLRTVPDGTYDVTQNFVPNRLNVLADQIEAFSSSVMGLTIGCARCHNHKYDPIPQRDYYRLSAIFRTAYDPYDWFIPNNNVDEEVGKIDWRQRYLMGIPEQEGREVEIQNAPYVKQIKQLEESLEQLARPYRQKWFDEELAKYPEELRQDVNRALAVPSGERSQLQKHLVEKFASPLNASIKQIESRFQDFRMNSEKSRRAIRKLEENLKPQPRIRALFDMGGTATPTYVLRRGEYLNPGPRVEPGVPSALRDGIAPYNVAKPKWTTETSGRRLALARWLSQPNHPLTSRVMVNRVWQHHFGRGLVTTTGNFGKTGSPPSHPDLLDWLATEFVSQRWSLKALHKLIMTSAAYRQSSSATPGQVQADPNNLLLSRFPIRRLDADAVRDSLLKVSQRLSLVPFGPPDKVEVQPDGEVTNSCGPGECRRSIYLLQRRTTPLTILEAFDAPQLNPNCLQRPVSTVASQALLMWNSGMVRENSRHFAGRVIESVGADVERQIEEVYLRALCRRPSEDESKTARREIDQLAEDWLRHHETNRPAEPRMMKAKWEALATFCHAVLNSAEFIYVD